MERPLWIIKSVTKVKGTEDYDPAKAVCDCDKCGAPLFAQFWSILNTAEDKVWVVGSTCVKALTGQTVTQLKRGESEFLAGSAAEEDERLKQVTYSQFYEVNAELLNWLDSHIERVHAVGEKLLAKWKSDGGEYPNLPSSEFWDSLRDQAHEKGAWTQGQLDAVKREMEVNHEAVLPAKKDRTEFEGEVVQVRLKPGFKEKDPDGLNISMKDHQGAVLFVPVGYNTELFVAVEKSIWNEDERTAQAYGSDRARRLMAFIKPGMKLKVKGTCKGTSAVGGKVYLNRCKFISLEK